MALKQELTKTQHAADAADDVDITVDDVDITADKVPLLGLSEDRHPAPPPPPYGIQNESPSVNNQPRTLCVLLEQPRTIQATMVQYVDVESYMPLSVSVCLGCFWPLGLWALFKSNESEILASVGRYPQAKQKGKEAKILNIIGIIIGVIINAIIFIHMVVRMYLWRQNLGH